MTVKTALLSLCLAGILTLSNASLQAENVILEWDANTESDLNSYILFRSEKSFLAVNEAPVTVEQALADPTLLKTEVFSPVTSIEVTGLVPGKTYYFRLAARNTSGRTSDFNVNSTGLTPEELVIPVAYASSGGRPAKKILSPGLRDGINDEAIFEANAREVFIFDFNGRKVFHTDAAQAPPGGLKWDGRDSSGSIVPSGVYIALIKHIDGGEAYQKIVVVR